MRQPPLPVAAQRHRRSGGEDSMQYVTLGDTGLMVSRLALGTMVFGEDGPRGTPRPEAVEMVARFLDAGGTHIDTANVYAAGRSEEIVGEAIRGHRDEIVLATKVRFPMGPGPNDQGLSRYHITGSVEASLRRLGTDRLDLLYMHCWDPITPLDESLETFDDLVRAGKVQYIGVSNFTAWQMMKALGMSDANGWARFVAAQYQYSLVVRDIERELTDLAIAEGVGIVPWGPLGGGFLSGKYRADRPPVEDGDGRIAVMPDHAEESWSRRATERNWAIVDVVGEIATAHDRTPSQVALAWLLARPGVASVIIGVRTMSQLEDNLAALECRLSFEDLDRLDEVSAFDHGYPYRFLANYGGRSTG
jgi:aryl-alcohol dehydrogenase-like predicted oxidoreductase